MSGFEFFFADQNFPFLVAMGVTLLIAVIEVAGLLLGLGLSEAIDNMLPDLGPGVDAGVDLDLDLDLDIDADLDAEPADPGAFSHLLGWLNVGRVPFLVLLIVLLTSFSVAGFAAQLAIGSLGLLLPAWIVAPAAFAVALPTTRAASRLVGHLIPREETYAVGEEEFVGRTATITLGPVDAATPGKAKLIDQHGNVHFVRLRAAGEGLRFEQDASVLLVGLEGSVFEAIAPPDSLTGDPS